MQKLWYRSFDDWWYVTIKENGKRVQKKLVSGIPESLFPKVITVGGDVHRSNAHKMVRTVLRDVCVPEETMEIPCIAVPRLQRRGAKKPGVDRITHSGPKITVRQFTWPSERGDDVRG